MYNKIIITGTTILSVVILYYFYGNKPSKSTERVLPPDILIGQYM